MFLHFSVKCDKYVLQLLTSGCNEHRTWLHYMDPKSSLGYNENRHDTTVKFWESHNEVVLLKYVRIKNGQQKKRKKELMYYLHINKKSKKNSTHCIYHYYIHIKNIIHTQNSRAIIDSSSSFPRLWRPNNILCCGWSLKSFKSQFVENVTYRRTYCQHLKKQSANASYRIIWITCCAASFLLGKLQYGDA